MNKKILQDLVDGCAPIAAGFILAAIFCLLLTLCSCRPTQKLVEVEKWRHDTVTVVDTMRIVEEVVKHDSVFNTEFVTLWKHDTVNTNVAYKYYTYNDDGSVKTFLDYVSSTQQGSKTEKKEDSATTSVSDVSASKVEASGHSESSGHTEKEKSKEQTKTGLTRWQKFVMGMGYTFIVLLVLGCTFAGMRFYGKMRKL